MERERRREALAKRRRRKVQRIKRIIFGVIAAGLVAGGIAIISNGMFWIDKIAMSKQKEDLKEYYGIKTEEQLAVIIDNKVIGTEAAGMIWDGEPYVEYSVVRDYLNSRVYVDMNENLLLYTLPTGTISARVGSKEYSLQKETIASEYAFLKMEGKTAYVALPFVKQYTNMEYKVFQDKGIARVVINHYEGDVEIATIKRNVFIRTDADRKATTLVEEKKRSQVRVVEKRDNWVQVRTEDGFIGYVKSRYLKDIKKAKIERPFTEVEAKNISKDYTINMAWHLVTNSDANNNIFEMIADEKGLTTISPTWFTIKDTSGNISSLASQRYVDYVHKMKKEVWALVKDFDGGIHSEEELHELLSHSSARENLINQLMAEVVKYDIDGINVDFEQVSQKSGEHFLQFVRELSVRCRQNEVVLSIDNYVPSTRNIHYNLEEQVAYADYIVIMSYDEYYAGSEESGPVASTSFVETAIVNALTSVPAERLINGVPLYTRLWSEKEKADGSIDVSSIAYGMDEAQMKIAQAGAEITVDEATGHNYAQWKEGNVIYKIWLEDETALESKLKLMKDYKLAGLSLWRLGFESQEAWEIILKYVN